MHPHTVSKERRSWTAQIIWSLRVAYDRMRRRYDVHATILLVLFVAATGWVADGAVTILTLVNLLVAHAVAWLPGVSLPAGASWPDWVALLYAALALLALVAVLFVIRARYRDTAEEAVAADTMAPRKRKGLIVLLSPYGRTSAGLIASQTGLSRPQVEAQLAEARVPSSVDELEVLLDASKEGSRQHLHLQAFATRWGTLAAAVVHHRETLEYCWIVSSASVGGSSAHANVAARLVQALAMKDVACYTQGLVVPNGHDIEHVVPVVDRIYRERLPELSLPVDEAIADFTGGTAAMTAGMILATLAPERAIEYLRQDAPLLFASGDALFPKAPEMLADGKGLVEVYTHPELVPKDDQSGNPF